MAKPNYAYQKREKELAKKKKKEEKRKQKALAAEEAQGGGAQEGDASIDSLTDAPPGAPTDTES
jgi:hypothetical protein